MKGLQKALSGTYDVFPQPADIGDGAKRPLYWNKSVFEATATGSYDIPKGAGTVGQPWVLLKHKESGRSFFVTNAHLAVGDSMADSDDRRDGARRMLDAIAKNNKQDAPVIMTGDYNSTCVKTTGDRSEADLPCKIFEKASLRDTEAIAADHIGEEYATSHGGVDSINRDPQHHVDHVFISDTIPKVASWENIVDSTTRVSSDHTPVAVSLVTGIASKSVAGWQWPVKGNIRNGNCWNVFVSGLGRHAGMDINSTVNGNEAIAAHGGTVVEIDRAGNGAGGRYVIVKTDTSPALYYSYQHLASIAVDEGEKVTAGQTKIGIIGVTGRVINGGPGHLHFVVAVAQTLGSYANNSQTRDPMKYLPEDAPDNYKCIGGSSAL
jgi:murein DD-endopeptidase MepM/ murein hydrolase activator NlpD